MVTAGRVRCSAMTGKSAAKAAAISGATSLCSQGCRFTTEPLGKSCVTPGEFKKIKDKQTSLEKTVQMHSKQLHINDCLINSMSFTTEVQFCQLTGALCIEKFKYKEASFTPVLFADISAESKSKLSIIGKS